MRFRGLRAMACAAVAVLVLTLGLGRLASAADLPAVGTGSTLVLYATAAAGHHPATDTLYLVDQVGDRYQIAQIPDSDASARLIAWSGDGTRALVQLPGGGVEQIALAGGQTQRLSLPAGVTVLGYAGPDGCDILGEKTSGGRTTLASYTPDGALAAILTTWPSGTAPTASPVFGTAALATPAGDYLVLPGSAALSVVSTLGGGSDLLSLPVSRGADCEPVRWWQPGVVLAECSGPGITGPRLWLVPASGARPTALTPQRGENGPDYGDINGWEVPGGGLYVQALASCGPPFIAAAGGGGAVTPVLFPGVVVAQSGQWLLTEQAEGCLGGNSLLWFDPVTHGERWVLRAPAADPGVISAAAFAN